MKLDQDVEEQLDKCGLYAGPDGKVDWRDDAPDHPKNWPTGRKVFDTAVITVFVTISYVPCIKKPADTAC